MVAAQSHRARFAVTRFAAIFLAVLVLSVPALAQMYPGEDVTVNPQAAGTEVLLYPGGKYVRVLPPLREPGSQNGPIHLHMPKTYHHHVAKTEPAPEPEAMSEATSPAPKPAHHRHVSVAAETPAPAPVESSIPDEPPPPVHHKKPAAVHHEVAAVVHHEAPPAPIHREAPPTKAASTSTNDDDYETVRPDASKPAPAEFMARAEPAPAERVARTEPVPAPTVKGPKTQYGVKRGTIVFAQGASDPPTSAVNTAKALADQLAAALADGSAHVELVAYGGPRGERTSDTRRLALKRAVIIRQLLIDDGVPAERIDGHAMGGVEDNGPADRVDIFVKS